MATNEIKRTYAEAQRDAEAFLALFDTDCFTRWEFGGSLRRKRPDVSDIEHIILPATGDVPGSGLFSEPTAVNLLWHRLNELVASGMVTKHVYTDKNGKETNRWGDKYRGVDFRGFNHEIFCADANNWGSVLTIRTGPWQFSKEMVTRLLRRGFKNEDGYLKKASGEMIPCPDENTYFAFAGTAWIKPEDRDRPEALL